MATTSLANRSTSVSSEPEATSDGHVGASLCWRYARISLVYSPRTHWVGVWEVGFALSCALARADPA